MAMHKFAIGQSVEVVAIGRFDGQMPRGVYTVVRQLPGDGMDFEYRVKSSRDSHEWAVRESRLRQANGLG